MRRGLWRPACAVTLLAVSAAGCGDDISRPGPVLLVGDSIFFQAANELKAELEGDGWTVIVVAHLGAGIGGGGYSEVDWAAALRDVLALEPEIVVVELGTNGCGDRCESTSAAVDAFMERLEDVPQVLWLTARTEPPGPVDTEAINDVLREAEDEYLNLEVLPYHEWFRGRPDLAPLDDAHLPPPGQQALAEKVREAVADHAD